MRIVSPAGVPDYHVDTYDLEKLADDWLNPYDLSDMAILASQWLQCNDPQNVDCEL